MVWVSSVPAIAQQSVSATIEKTDEALGQTKDALDSSRGVKAKLDAQVSESKGEVLHVRRELIRAAAAAQDIEARVSALESNLVRLEDERREKLVALEGRQVELSWALGALQRIGRVPPELLIFMPVSLQEVSHARVLLRNIAGELDARVEILAEELLRMRRLGERISAQRYLIDLEAERLELQRAHLGILLSHKIKAYNRTEAKYHRAEALVVALAAEAENLQELLESLVADHGENERLWRAAKAEAKALEKVEDVPLVMAKQKRSVTGKLRKPRVPSHSQQTDAISVIVNSDNMVFKNIEPAIAQKPVGGVANIGEQTGVIKEDLSVLNLAAVRPSVSMARGVFSVPVRGALVSRFDESTDLGLSTKGIVIETRSRAQIIAPYDGRIVFAGQFRDYGLLLIIDHGEGYHTLLSGMGRIDVMVDQYVLAGEPVGVMRSAEDSEPRLYVELRSGGEPINPLPWLAVETIKVSG